MKSSHLLTLLLAISFLSCKNDNSNKPDTNVSLVEDSKKYKLVAFDSSTEFQDATIDSYSYADGKFDFNVSGTDYKLGDQTPDAPQKMCANSGKGQHIHLIIDDEPYAAKYTSSFEYEIEDGTHHLLAFLSRSYHESIKTSKASTMQVIEVKDGSITNSSDIADPIMFYSRPKGTYVGKDTEKVMLDFFLGNIQLGENKVLVNINGEDHMVDKWQPYYILGLPMGENTVTLTLLDNKGEKINTALNPVSRIFTLKSEPTEES